MQSQKTFIFDFDGTLAETIVPTLDAIQDAFKAKGIPVPSVEKIKSTFGAQELGIFKMLAEENAEELFQEYLKIFTKICEDKIVKPFDGIVQALETLQERGIQMHLVTGKSRESADISLDKMGLRKFFKNIECGGMTGSVKTEKIKKILAEYKLNPNDVYYIGDIPRDVEDARNAGIHPLSAAWSNIASIEDLKKVNPEQIFTSTAQFLQNIKTITEA